mgnify:CR=1 FL=1
MIEWDIVAKIKADTTMDTLLSSTGTDPKLYPLQAPPGAVTPYILYACAGMGPEDEVLDEERLQFTVVDSSYKNAGDIRDRLKAIFDLQDRVSITSDTYYIYWGKLTGNQDLVDTELSLYNRVVFFNFKFRKKTE